MTKKSPGIQRVLFLIILMQLAVFIFVSSKGAGKIYADMILILLGITMVSCFLNRMGLGNQKIMTYTLALLTVGTMLQCTFKEENLMAASEEVTRNPALSLQIQYILAMFAACISGIAYRKWDKISSLKVCKIMMLFSVSLSIITLLLAKSVGNVRNWLTVGGFSLQTTEIVKLIYIFVAAALLAREEGPSIRRQRTFAAFTLLNVCFLALQSEFGTMLLLIIMYLIYILLYVPGRKTIIKTVVIMACGILILVIAGSVLTDLRTKGNSIAMNPVSQIFLHNYDKIANRFIFWLNPERDPQGLGYQLIQARNSILLGGWFGTSSITDLPVKSSDLVYPALIQRCGLVFAILVFLLFIMNWLEGIRLFVRKKNCYHSAIAAGIVYMFFVQALIIIGGSTGLCPLTGITLPFISSGGSSLLVSSVMTAILLAVSGNVRWEGKNDDEEEFYKESTAVTKYCSALCHSYAGWIGQSIRRRSGNQPGGGSEERQSKTGYLSKRIYKGKHSRQKWDRAC